nr:hypothetical protein GCM10020092_043230 [Actinoplanes digitatis]
MLGQRPDQRDHDLLAQARHRPAEVLGVELVEQRERHPHGHAVAGRAGLELVAQRQPDAAGEPGVRVGARVDGVAARVDEQLAGEGEQAGVGVPGRLPPRVEVPGGDDVGGDAGVVEGVHGLVVDGDVPAAGPVLDLLDPGQELGVLGEERVMGLPVPLDERVPDEQLAAHRRIDPGVADLAPGHDRQPVEGHLLVGHHGALLLLPVRLAVAALDQVRRELLGPLGLDARVHPAPEPRRLDQLGRHHPAWLLLEQGRAREDRELGAAGAEIFALVRVLQADVREQAGEQGRVHGLTPAELVTLGEREPEGTGDLPQLRVDVLPLADPQVVEELGTAQPSGTGCRTARAASPAGSATG